MTKVQNDEFDSISTPRLPSKSQISNAKLLDNYMVALVLKVMALFLIVHYRAVISFKKRVDLSVKR